MAELDAVCDQPELFAMVHDAPSNPDDPAIESLRAMARLVESLPLRVKVAKDPVAAARARRAERSLRDAFWAFMEDRKTGRKSLAAGTLRD